MKRESSMKIKTISIIILITSLISASACSEKKNNVFRVYPLKKEIKAVPGSNSFIALRLVIPERHHVYGNPKGPGIGKATTVTMESDQSIVFKSAQYLPPVKYKAAGDKNFTWIYEKETTLFVPFTAHRKVEAGTYPVKARVDALLCNDTSCLPRVLDVKLTIVIASANSSYSPDIISLYKLSRAPGGEKMEILPAQAKPLPQSQKGETLKGTVFTPVVIESTSIAGILQALLFGLIAGFILNFMPCVLPVVSLKIMGFVQHAGKDRKELTRLGLLFSLGILVSFALLAALAAFLGYNWGDLFQHEFFIITLTAIIFALALSLFDIFTIHPPSFLGKAGSGIKSHYSDAFIKGLLATLLATPCSGPFLGGTLAWALSQPPLTIFLIFMSVGTGMALPYLALSINPAFIRFIPKPGEWTRTFENIMGFFLIFTVVYLLNILKPESLMPMMTFLAFIAMGFWQYGRYGSLDKKKPVRRASLLLLLLLIISGYSFSFKYLFAQSSEKMINFNVFSTHDLKKNRDAGKISIVKFTADWCPNCKLVEKLSLETEKVAERVNSNNIDVMAADITHSNPPAKELLLKLNSRSIPFLAVFPGGKGFSSPICLRDIYSEDDVLKAIEKAREKTSGGVRAKFRIK
jgi:thiol:disulfide interchange protein